jgi:hypothetical protein
LISLLVEIRSAGLLIWQTAAGEAKFPKKVIARPRAVAIIRVRFRKNRERNFINH